MCFFSSSLGQNVTGFRETCIRRFRFFLLLFTFFLDLDEFETGNNSCPKHAHCIKVIGSYTCECHHGYQGKHCLDVDECKLGIHTCNGTLTAQIQWARINVLVELVTIKMERFART